MANTLTNLIPDMYRALDVVSREQLGFVHAVTRNVDVEMVAKDQKIQVPVTTEGQAEDITPGATPPDTGDQTVDTVEMTISKARAYPIRYNGEEQQSITDIYDTVLGQQFEQGFRTLANEMESDLSSLYTTASRAYGTAGTTPFASDLTDTAQIRKILVDNGAPTTNLQMVLDSTAGAKMRTLTNLTRANEAGGDSMLREGDLGRVHRFAMHESGDVGEHTKGTGTGYLVNSAGLVIGSTTIPADTGTGTIVAGDVVTFAGDSNKYLVTSDLSGGSFTIAAPGLRTAVADDAAITIGNDYTANMGFARSAIVLASRIPKAPKEGDAATDSRLITDPVSGITFEIRQYGLYRQVRFEIAIAWGYKNIKPEHTAVLLG